ncbi:hypothetical protein GGQ88_003379 [Novosphingobium hassiacum]|uniref:DUF3617 family protein n=1 Tax=Novosphingobium hassiacum TaxID=173676 RepID=A0A7W6EXH5_9SPHN|nr:hypothetical protein [Novosphingobium hassiacum]MBB3862085.1 hypothetical protein [Novosphingobium hassiacum]
MKSGLLALAALLASTTASAGTPAAPLVTINGSGQGSWEVLCHVASAGGDETIRALGPDRPTLALTSLRRATCNYKNGARGPLTIAIVSTAFACPFTVSADASCETQFKPGAFGSIELRRKP